jgi:hypothetical protein
VTLDNRRKNLRPANPIQSSRNRGINRNNTSGTSGVVQRKDNGKWRSYINVEWKRIWFGPFDTRQEAVAARVEAEIKYFGEFSRSALGTMPEMME